MLLPYLNKDLIEAGCDEGVQESGVPSDMVRPPSGANITNSTDERK